jgi:UDP-N-acetylmuramate dehydrogenase
MHDLRRTLGEAIAGCAAEVRFDEPLAQHTTFRIGGPADAWVRANDRQALARVLQFCRASGVRWWLLGRGSNVLVSDQGLRGIVIGLGGEMDKVKVSGADTRSLDPSIPRSLSVGAGASLDEVATVAEKAGLIGAEFLAGIPGTVGGGLHSNAGAFGRSLGDVVASVTVVDRDGNDRDLTGTELRREYRLPMIDDGLVAVDVTMELHPGKPEPAAGIREQRWAKHPKEPSAGSFFRNPEVGEGSGGRGSKGSGFGSEPRNAGTRGPLSAGRLIEQCGLKGKAIGGAKVSEKHANFLVNTGGARFADVYELAQVVKATVEQETGILLEEEVRYLPNPDEVRGQKSGGGSR